MQQQPQLQANQNQARQPKLTLLSSPAVQCLSVGLFYSATQPVQTMLLFSQTKDLNPYLVNNGIKLDSVLDLYRHFKKRDGSYKLMNCFWGNMLTSSISWSMLQIRGYLVTRALKIQRPVIRRDPETQKPQKPTLKESLQVFTHFCSSNLIQSLVCYPFMSSVIKLMTDYEPVPHFDHLVDCLCKTVEKDGFFGLYRGFKFEVLGILISGVFESFLFWRNLPNVYKISTYKDETVLFHAVRFVEKALEYALMALRSRCLVNPGAEPLLRWELFNGFWFQCFASGCSFTGWLLLKYAETLNKQNN